MQKHSYNTVCGFTKFEALFLFGYDGHAVIVPDSQLTLPNYLDRLEVYKKANSFHFAAVGISLWTTVSVLLFFWVMIAILLLKPDAETKQTIELFKRADLPEMPKSLETLIRFEVAIANLK